MQKPSPSPRWLLEAWTLAHTLFCEKTSLLYDSLGGRVDEQRFCHLPYPEEIALGLPNPAGWGTGMEDCMLNAGTLMDACLLRAESAPTERERNESLEFARALASGMTDCATKHGVRGYVVRGISPRDGRSCYTDSSRDQFTLFAYGLWRFYESPLAVAEDRTLVRRLLRVVADYCLRTIRPGKNGNILRLDGRRGLIGEMLNVGVHEVFRLPMLYLLAWSTNGKPRHFQAYEALADAALERTAQLETKTWWWNLELMQLQCSLAPVVTLDPNGARREQAASLMSRIAQLALAAYPEAEARLLSYPGPWDTLATHWREAPRLTLRPESLRDTPSALFEGTLYLKPHENPVWLEPFDILRALGNLATTIALAPTPHPPMLERYLAAAGTVPYARHTSAGVCNILQGAYRLALSEKTNS